jgi:hypothetical protein
VPVALAVNRVELDAYITLQLAENAEESGEEA